MAYSVDWHGICFPGGEDESEDDADDDYSYPGNVRELMNLLERAAVLDEKDFRRLVARHREMNAGFCAEGEENEPEVTAPDLLDEAIKRHVRRVLVKYASNVTRAAVALGISRTTLRKWL